MPSFVKLLAAALSVLSAAAAAAQPCTPSPGLHVVKPGTMQMSVNPTLPPQEYVNDRGELLGLNIDLAAAIAKRLCLEPVFIRMDAQGMVPGLNAGRFDMVNNGFFWTAERAKVLFLVPYAQHGFTVITAPNSPLKIASFDDLAGLQRRDGGFVRPGCDGSLDETRALRDASRQVIANLQQRYCDLAETKRLKVKHNNMLGYFVEVPQVLGETFMTAPLNATFIHRSTMVDAMRFSTAELSDLESRIASAADSATLRENAIFDDLAAAILAASDAIDAAGAALAAIDVAAGLAEIAAVRDWVRPEIEESGAFEILGGRHPVVEAALGALGEPFVANDCDLSADVSGGKIAVVTGPNMAGKSTFLRQNALIAVLAQMGAFVPARSARIGIVDRLFSRVGAADDLARGRSTFMVEMVETAAILNRATQRSLVILDEIGRGTATFDGLSIAWAVMEHLHEKNRSRAIFATHFHELTQLSRRLHRLTNLTTRVADWHGDVVFLHEVVPGAADRSYGIQVAKLAGLPPAVVRRARSLLAELEAGDRGAPFTRLLADLPLFANVPRDDAGPSPVQMDDRAVRDALAAIDPDLLTPREALEALYRLKAIEAADSVVD